MSIRLIDANELISAMYYYEHNEGGLTAYDAQDIINKAPSIDIVFCKDCKKANTEDCSHSYWDDDWGEWRVGYRGDDWFCADGEREGE